MKFKSMILKKKTKNKKKNPLLTILPNKIHKEGQRDAHHALS